MTRLSRSASGGRSSRRPALLRAIAPAPVLARPQALLLVILPCLLLGPSAAEAQEPVAGEIRGVVHDSIADAPLEGATVLLLGSETAVVTGPSGTFRLDEVEAGVHRATFFHPRLDELGLGPASWEIEVMPGEVTRAELWIPSAASIARALCRSEPGVLLGTLRDEDDGDPVMGTVTVRWDEAGRTRSSVTMTEERGRYVLCGLPTGRTLRIQGTSAEGAGAFREVRLPGTGILARDLALDVDAPGSVAGRIVAADGGEPVAGATVRIEGAGAAATSDAAGGFRLESVSAGRRALEVEHVAFGVHGDTVEVGPGASVRVRVEVPVGAVELEGVEVTAERRYRGRMAGFEDRMEQGRGEFLTREQIAQRENQPLPRIITSRSNSLRLMCADHPGRNPTGSVGRCWLDNRRAMRSLQDDPSNPCPMEYFVDGNFLSSSFDITQIDPHDVEAIEIYPGPSTIPTRFKVGRANCGVVLIWTREPGTERSR